MFAIEVTNGDVKWKSYVGNGKKVPSRYIIGFTGDEDWVTIEAGQMSPEGEDIIITSDDNYIVNRREYPLKGYGIKAKFTEDGVIVPVLRHAFNKEREVEKDDDGTPINSLWPVVVKLDEIGEEC